MPHSRPSSFAADGNLPTALALLGRLQPAIERRDRAGQNEIVRQLIDLAAPLGEQWMQLACLAVGNGEITLARQAGDLFVQAAFGSDLAQYQKASLLALLGAWSDADAVLQTLPDTVPDPASNAFSRGTTALNLGRPDEARQHLERVTLLRPQSGLAWFSLTMATDVSREPELAERLLAAEREVNATAPAERVPYWYAVGKMRAERGEHAEAFAAFSRGALLMKSAVRYDRSRDIASASDAVAGYDPARMPAGRSLGQDPARTIFVTGLPRSGTTLVEQILTHHSAVTGGGEIGRLFLLAQEIGGSSSAALEQYLATHGAEPAIRLWHHWLDELYPRSGRVVDKTTDASRFLGLAAAVLPDAPLIWMTRNPLDRAWSCFRTNFAGSAVPWSYDLGDIAAHFRLEDELLAKWGDILGDRLLVVAYEDLVTAPATWIRHILAHCGLPEEPQVFSPHENPRAVSTASLMQIRRPINRDGIGAAEPYREFLQPFLDAYHA